MMATGNGVMWEAKCKTTTMLTLKQKPNICQLSLYPHMLIYTMWQGHVLLSDIFIIKLKKDNELQYLQNIQR